MVRPVSDDPAYYTFVDAESGDLLWRKNFG